MRTAILALIVVAASAIAFQAGQPNEQMQRDADKGIKTRNSGESGYVADQDKSAASAHPPGRPGSEQTTGSGGQTGTPK